VNLFINAANVHTGGGYTLLCGLLQTLDSKMKGFVFLDKRCHLDFKIPENFVAHEIEPTLRGRLSGELKVTRLVRKNDIVLYLGNLPPLFKLKGKTCVYLQNRYLVERGGLKGFSLFVRLRIALERIWLVWRKKNVDMFFVQTPSMRRIVKKNLKKTSEVMPFHSEARNYKRFFKKNRKAENSTFEKSPPENKKWDFLYVASGYPHKNHRCLIEAWISLSGEGITPRLCLTIDEETDRKLCEWIEDAAKKYGLNIYNAGQKSYESVADLYRNTKALIYPSLYETIGLPLIEARSAGLPVIASELDYVRDVVDPEQSFDPASEISIARAVKRFMGVAEKSLPLKDPGSFITEVLKLFETKKGYAGETFSEGF